MDDVLVERPWRILTHEEVYLKRYESLVGAQKQIGAYHSSTPTAGRTPPKTTPPQAKPITPTISSSRLPKGGPSGRGRSQDSTPAIILYRHLNLVAFFDVQHPKNPGSKKTTATGSVR
ncbi:MAG: hypothetical protein EAZ36_02375 [Verrucomicrobia bacterium]|nr:MAG: hypothetical protein EAZ36_02375 [Verrucomicrobiota bacterium]